MDRFRIGVVGGDTREGQQLIRLLLAHPVAELVAVSSRGGERCPVSQMIPALYGLCGLSFVSAAEVLAQADVVFSADIAADSQELAAQSIKNKCVFLDMGTAFRLASADEYRLWFGSGFIYPGLHEAAVYGLPELLREHMTGKVVVGIPGAAATAALIALVPLLNEGLIECDGIRIDAKLPEGQDTAVFDVGRYAETPEIEQILSEAAGRTVRAAVIPCCTPSERGLVVTCTARAALAANARTLKNALESYYSGERFVRVLPSGARGASADSVIGSNICEVSAHFDERTGTVTVCAALDSLMKGSAGQAVQCMNRVLSMPEEIGLEELPFV